MDMLLTAAATSVNSDGETAVKRLNDGFSLPVCLTGVDTTGLIAGISRFDCLGELPKATSCGGGAGNFCVDALARG